jgi:hypothetical protein
MYIEVLPSKETRAHIAKKTSSTEPTIVRETSNILTPRQGATCITVFQVNAAVCQRSEPRACTVQRRPIMCYEEKEHCSRLLVVLYEYF